MEIRRKSDDCIVQYVAGVRPSTSTSTSRILDDVDCVYVYAYIVDIEGRITSSQTDK